MFKKLFFIWKKSEEMEKIRMGLCCLIKFFLANWDRHLEYWQFSSQSRYQIFMSMDFFEEVRKFCKDTKLVWTSA